MGVHRPRLELGMKLTSQIPGVIFEFDNLHQVSAWRSAADDQTFLLQYLTEFVVEFVSMAVTLGNIVIRVSLVSQCILDQSAGVCPQPHGPSLGGIGIPFLNGTGLIVIPFGHQVDDREWGGRFDFGTVGTFQAGHMPGKFHDSDLHAQTDPEIGNLIFTGIARRADFAFDAPGTKAAGNQDAVRLGQGMRTRVGGNRFRIHKQQIDPAAIGQSPMAQSLVEAFI